MREENEKNLPDGFLRHTHKSRRHRHHCWLRLCSPFDYYTLTHTRLFRVFKIERGFAFRDGFAFGGTRYFTLHLWAMRLVAQLCALGRAGLSYMR